MPDEFSVSDFAPAQDEFSVTDFTPKQEEKPSLFRSLFSKAQQAGAALAGNVVVNPLEAVPKVGKALGYPLEQISGVGGDVLVDFLTRTGIDPSAEVGQPIGGTTPRVPIATIPGTGISPLDVISPEIRKGIESGAGRLLEGIRTPEMVSTLPFAGLKPVQALYAASAAGAVPGSLEAMVQAKTARERAQAGTEAAANLLIARQLGKNVLPSVTETTPPAEPAAEPTQANARPAIRLVGGEVVTGEAGQTHPDIIKANDLKATDIDQRGFVDDKGNFKDREQAAQQTALPTQQEEKRLHSTDLPEAQPETQTEPATMTGAAHVSEIPEVSQTGLKNAVADMERVGLGLQDAPETVTRNMAGAWEQAGQIEQQKPGTGANLAAMLSRDPDLGLTDTESALLLRHKVDLWNRMNDAAERSHRGDAASRARAQAEHDVLAGQFGQLLDAVRLRGREWGREGRWRQAMAQDDYTFTSVDELNSYRRSATGKDLTEEQKSKGEQIAEENKKAQSELGQASDALNEQIKQKKVADPEQAKVWELARKYLEENKGFYGFDDLRNKIAADLGMTPEQVTKLLAKDKTTKKLADEVWTKQRNARRLKEQSKQWVKGLDTPGYIKALASIPRAMFSLSVFGHGFVALGTHAPIVAFQPRFWNAYFRNFGKMYKMVFSPAYYESQMQDLVRRPNYEKFRRAGLQNDPFKYEEFHTTVIRDLVKDWIGEKNMERVDNLASAGNRGYAVLKLLRQDMADQKYSKLPDSIRGQDGVLEALSDDINHATGVTKKQAPRGSNILLFAPRLAGSRVMWLGGDPIRAARAVADWKNAPEAEKLFARNQMKEKAWVFGTFASILAANQGLLTASGSKQKINGIPERFGGAGFDPLASDFMKFKAAGANIAYGGALLTMAKLPVRVATAILYEGKGSKYILEDERVDKVIGAYIRSQMSPFAGTVSDLALGRDYQERPLPAKLFGAVEQTGAVPKRLQAQGVDEPYNWAEFAATKLPIPVAEGIKEGLRGSGMPEEQVDYWMKALAITSLMTATGTRISEDTREPTE